MQKSERFLGGLKGAVAFTFPELPQRDSDIPVDHAFGSEGDLPSLEFCFEHVADGDTRLLSNFSGQSYLVFFFDPD